ncbi:MAG TPA: hypothetical protein VH349_11430 [Ktedonobacterales bacterium]
MSVGAEPSSLGRIEMVALGVQGLLGKFASAFCGLGLAILLGFDPVPATFPLRRFWADDQIAAVILLAIVGVIGGVSFIIAWRRRPGRTVKTRLQRVLGFLRSSALEIIIGFLAGLFLGVGSAPSVIPVLSLIRDHPPVGIGIGVVLLIIVMLIPLLGASDDPLMPEPEQSQPRTRIWLATTTSFVMTTLLFSLVGLITIRPSWCPTSICPAPQLVTVTNPNGVHDGIMEAYYLAEQSDAFVMTEDPARYTFSNLPNHIGAREIGSTEPYRAVVGIHSLQRGTRYGLVIDGVDALVDQTMDVTAPQNVFLQGPGLSYNTSIWTLKYVGEPASAHVPTAAPANTTQLEVGGSDELSIEVVTSVEVCLQFRVQVRYHQIAGDTSTHSLIVPHEFAVCILAPKDWSPYVFSDGKMAPQGKS